MAQLGPSSFGALNNILAMTTGDIQSALAQPGPIGGAAIGQTTGALGAAPDFAMPGGGGFYGTSPAGQAARATIGQERFAPLRSATIADTLNRIQLAGMLGQTGPMMAQDYQQQQQLTAAQQALQAATKSVYGTTAQNILTSLLGPSYGGIGGALASLFG